MSSWLSRPSLLGSLLSMVRLTTRLLREPGVPLLPKAVPVLAALYVISPIDAVPDVLPVLGQLDDLGIILLGLRLFVSLCPARAVEFHRQAMAAGRAYGRMPSEGEVIDAEFRRVDE